VITDFIALSPDASDTPIHSVQTTNRYPFAHRTLRAVQIRTCGKPPYSDQEPEGTVALNGCVSTLRPEAPAKGVCPVFQAAPVFVIVRKDDAGFPLKFTPRAGGAENDGKNEKQKDVGKL
jgi:hypothetical protein